MQAKNIDELKRAIEQATTLAFRDASKSVEGDMQDSIQKYVYDAYTPSKYSRTGQLKQAYQLLNFGATNKMHSACLDFDFSVMTVDPAEYRHYSPIYGTPFVTGLPEAIQMGKTGASGFFGSGGFSQPRDFMQDYHYVVGRFEDNFIDWTKDYSGLIIRKK